MHVVSRLTFVGVDLSAARFAAALTRYLPVAVAHPSTRSAAATAGTAATAAAAEDSSNNNSPGFVLVLEHGADTSGS